MAVAVKPSNSLLNIRSGIKSIKNSFSGLRKNAGNLNDVVLKKTKVKRESIVRNAILSQRRQEQERRKNKEDLLEASTIGGAVKRQAKAVASSTKGFLGRIMDFLATLLVGWLLTNLPSIITMAQELIARIQRLYTIVTGFFDNTIKLFRGFGNLLGAVGKNILTFDFMDSKGRVESSLKDLGGTFEDMQSQFDEGFRLLTTSLGEGVVSGEDAAPFGTQYENESMQQQPTPSGGGFSGSGVAKGTQIAKRLQKDLGLKDYQAAAVVGNLLQENTNLVPDLLEGSKKGLLPEAMRKGIGYGWAQWTYPGRQRELYQLAQSMGVDPSKQPLTDEINYAMLVKELPRYDSGGRFRNSKTIEEASNWILFQYENPADKGSREQGERISDSRKILQSLKVSPAPQQSSTPQQSTPVSGQSFRPLPQGSFKGGERQRYLASRDGGKRKHLGIDITESNWKRGTDPRIPVVAIRGGVVSSRDYVGGTKYDSGMVIDQDDGYSVRYLHMTPSVRPGQKVSAGQRIGRLVDLGDQTHLHIELYSGSKILDPTEYIKTVEKGGVPPSIARQQSKLPSPAQITPTRTSQNPQISQSLAQERTGPTVIVSQNPEPVQQMMYSGGGGYSGGGSSQISDFALLNNFIKNKLLLDLAYL
jgi:murein DD-endopeptidase MepM/ murein hydrolase activator NlpD